MEIYAEVLNLDRIGIRDDFFHLGGDSLSATRLTARIKDRMGHQVKLRVLRRHTTPADLADLLRSAAAPMAAPGEV
ncbi:phosphopantetheine-binding protein [Nocardiopsis sp. ARC36]